MLNVYINNDALYVDGLHYRNDCNGKFYFCLAFQFKTLFPVALETIFTNSLPPWIANNPTGQKFWALIFAYMILLPMSIPRQLSALGSSTMISFLLFGFVVAVIVSECLFNRQANPDLNHSLVSAALTFNIDAQQLLSLFPIAIFSFMYQPNLPMIFTELVPQSDKVMRRAIITATLIVIVIYILTGFFGFATFVEHQNLA